ncbi:WS/DGAT domain-containing protein [Streptomyces sp. NPDC048639]|uniref:WS/DGAT domain-containing protein n=1 Tax=Streptomyces sp. NPDC048639 TaxID=3365581 RepID=UPI00371D6931
MDRSTDRCADRSADRDADRDAGPGTAGLPMPPVDAWLYRHQADGAICMTFGMLARFHGPPPVIGELRARVGERWCGLPRLRALPLERPWPHWTSARRSPDPGLHVVDHTGPVPCRLPAQHAPARPAPATDGATPDGATPDGVDVLAATLLAQPLDEGDGDGGGSDPVPPWRLHLLPAADGFALLLRAHHALLDGKALITLFRILLDGPGAYPLPPAAAHLAEPFALTPAPRSARLRAAAGLLPAGRRLPFHTRVDEGRALARSELPVAALRAAGRTLPGEPASVNSVFLAAVAAGLGSTGVLGARPGLPGVRAMVPVDLRSPLDEAFLGNHYTTVRLPLPASPALSAPDRLAAVDASSRRVAGHRLALAQARMVRQSSRRRGAVRDAFARYTDSPRYSSLLCTNVRTGAAALAIGGATLERLALVPALSPEHPLALSLTTHGPTAVVAVLTDAAHAALGAPLADRVRDEVLVLAKGSEALGIGAV